MNMQEALFVVVVVLLFLFLLLFVYSLNISFLLFSIVFGLTGVFIDV